MKSFKTWATAWNWVRLNAAGPVTVTYNNRWRFIATFFGHIAR